MLYKSVLSVIFILGLVVTTVHGEMGMSGPPSGGFPPCVLHFKLSNVAFKTAQGVAFTDTIIANFREMYGTSAPAAGSGAAGYMNPPVSAKARTLEFTGISTNPSGYFVKPQGDGTRWWANVAGLPTPTIRNVSPSDRVVSQIISSFQDALRSRTDPAKGVHGPGVETRGYQTSPNVTASEISVTCR
ncbi:MAG: hypothetical protein HYZ71_10590 [Deltaproteobacteria bacterium]|nr:hypothetical protein [Deltaproteobacteria bacterium]